MVILPTTLEEIERKALSVTMDFIHIEDLVSGDDFPIKVAHVYVTLVGERWKPPSSSAFLRSSGKVRTTFFRLNPRLSKRAFLEDLLEELNSEVSPLLNEVRTLSIQRESATEAQLCKRVFVESIDSFQRVREIESKTVESLVPLSFSENDIKRSLADIVGEKFVPKDWSGEKSDLYTSFVVLEGCRIGTAFMLKGPSVKRLTIDTCGKRGNQLLRLVKEPANLFVVQHVGEIDTDVIELLDVLVSDLSRKRKERLYYCTMDGVDTARVLRAYDKL